MKKVGELKWTEELLGSRETAGLLYSVLTNADGQEPVDVSLQEPVRVEPQQEAIFKVTHAITVELIDIRMRPPPPKPSGDIIIVAPAHQEGLWYQLKPEHIITEPESVNSAPPAERQKLEWACDTCGRRVSSSNHIPDRPHPCNAYAASECPGKVHNIPVGAKPPPVQTTQTKPVCHLGWGPTKCGLDYMGLRNTTDVWTNTQANVTCPECLKTLPPVKLEWCCEKCGRVVPSGCEQSLVGTRVSCTVCKVGDTVLRLAAEKPKKKTWRCTAGHLWQEGCGNVARYKPGHTVSGYCQDCEGDSRWTVVEE